LHKTREQAIGFAEVRLAESGKHREVTRFENPRIARRIVWKNACRQQQRFRESLFARLRAKSIRTSLNKRDLEGVAGSLAGLGACDECKKVIACFLRV
jgi:hypothetical protein